MDSPAPVDYALIQDGAIYQVAWALEGAAGAALSIPELADRYKHSMPSDLTRVRRHNKLGSDKAAEEWIVRRAIAFLAKWLVIENDTICFKEGVGYDDLRWRGKPIDRRPDDPYKLLHDPFDPMKGKFSDNIRIDLGDLTELRESMKAYGWIDKPQFRALGDKRGEEVILIGHRRIAVAKELGIDWRQHIDWLELGEGDAADAERFRLAIMSNVGAKPLSKPDRKRIAEHLYGEHDWSMERIAVALNVVVQTVSNDLQGISKIGKSKRGRPRVKKVRAPDEKQQQVSVNSRPGEWEQFKEQAEAEGYSAAAKLGELVRREVTLEGYHKNEAETADVWARNAATVANGGPKPEPANDQAPVSEVTQYAKQAATQEWPPAPAVCPTCGQPWPHEAAP